jgi:hypothetical protein
VDVLFQVVRFGVPFRVPDLEFPIHLGFDNLEHDSLQFTFLVFHVHRVANMEMVLRLHGRPQ